MLDMSEKIRLLAVKLHTSPAAIARASGQSVSNLSNKMTRNDFKTSELEKLAAAVGCSLEVNFIMPNGEKV